MRRHKYNYIIVLEDKKIPFYTTESYNIVLILAYSRSFSYLSFPKVVEFYIEKYST